MKSNTQHLIPGKLKTATFNFFLPGYWVFPPFTKDKKMQFFILRPLKNTGNTNSFLVNKIAHTFPC